MPQPHCLYINLDRSQARNEHMVDRFAALGVAATRVPAVDGRKLLDDFCEQLNPQGPNTRKLQKPEIGCFLSHREAWKLVVDGPHDHVVVCEDDVKLADDFGTIFADLGWVPDDIGVIKCDTMTTGAMMSNDQPVPGSGRVIKRIHTKAVSTACYVVSRAYARALLDSTQTLRAPVDIVMFDPKWQSEGSNISWQLAPAIAQQQHEDPSRKFLESGAETSVIAYDIAPKQKLHPLGKKRLMIELKRPFQQLERLIERNRLRLKYRARWQVALFRAGESTSS